MNHERAFSPGTPEKIFPGSCSPRIPSNLLGDSSVGRFFLALEPRIARRPAAAGPQPVAARAPCPSPTTRASPPPRRRRAPPAAAPAPPPSGGFSRCSPAPRSRCSTPGLCLLRRATRFFLGRRDCAPPSARPSPRPPRRPPRPPARCSCAQRTRRRLRRARGRCSAPLATTETHRRPLLPAARPPRRPRRPT